MNLIPITEDDLHIAECERRSDDLLRRLLEERDATLRLALARRVRRGIVETPQRNLATQPR